MTRAGKVKFAATLTAYDSLTCQRRRTDSLGQDDSKSKQKCFYYSLLEISWLSPKIRRAVMAELGLSSREQNRRIEQARTATLRVLINERKTQMRANGERPRGGIHDAAVTEIAGEQSMTITALRKRLERYK